MTLPSLKLGSVHLSPYAMWMGLGALLATAVSFYERSVQSKKCAGFDLAARHLGDAILLGLVGGLVGARATYVGINWTYYQDRLSEAVRPWAGGLTWEGGLVISLLVIVVHTASSPETPSPWRLLDLLAPSLALVAAFIWLASGTVGAACGRETYPSEGWLWRLSADLPDTYRLYAPRVNVQLLGAAWSGVTFGLLEWFGRRLPPAGTRFSLYLALTGSSGMILTALRGDPVPHLWGLRLDGLFNLGLTCLGVLGLGWSSRGSVNHKI